MAISTLNGMSRLRFYGEHMAGVQWLGYELGILALYFLIDNFY